MKSNNLCIPVTDNTSSFTILGNHMTKSKQKQAKLDETEKL